MAAHPILTRIDNLAQQVRRLVLGMGIARCLTTLIVGFLIIGLLDWLLWLPPVVRVLLALTLLARVGYVVARRLARPLSAPLTRSALAIRLENRFEALGDRLSSAVQFLTRPPPYASRAMMDEVVTRTHRILDDYDFRSAVSRQQLRKHFGAALGANLVLATLVVFAPSWPATALARMLLPFGPTEWPRTVSIEPLTGDAFVPYGGSFAAEMRVTRGDKPNLRAFVFTRDRDARIDSYPMQRGEDGVYRWTFAGLGREMHYWFRAGDDDTRSSYSTLTLVPRPLIEQVGLRISLPPYDGRVCEVSLPGDGGDAASVFGSLIELSVRVNKPLAASSEQPPRAWLVDEAGAAIPLRWADDTRTVLAGSLAALETRTLEVVVEDQYGFRSDLPCRIHLTAIEDRPPSVTIIQPSAAVEVTPQSRVSMRLAAADDLALSDLHLLSEPDAEGTAWPPIPLQHRLPAAAEAEPDGHLAPYGIELQHELAVEDFDAQPGDVLTIVAVAADNYSAEGQGPHVVRSAPVRLRVLSEAEYADRLQGELQMLGAGIRELLEKQDALRDEAESLRDTIGGGAELTDLDRQRLTSIATEENRLAARTETLSGRFARLLEQMEQNRTGDAELRGTAARIASELHELAEGALRQAAQSADDAAESAQPAARAAAMEQLSLDQQAAVQTMERLLLELQRWGGFESVVRKTRELYDRQESATQETARLSRETIGIPAEQLTEPQIEAARALARRQRRLAEESDQLLRRMGEVSAEGDASAQQSLEEAAQIGQTRSVAQRMRQAAEAIDANRPSRAGADQQTAQSILRSMLETLDERQERRLAELERKARQAEELLRYTLERQQQLLGDNRAAREHGATSDEVRQIAEPQRLLEGNTRQLARDLSRESETAAAAGDTRKAASKMALAGRTLDEGHGTDAEVPQLAAIELIEAALDALHEIRRKAQEELAKRAMQQLRDRLIEMHAAQTSIGDDVRALREVLTSDGRLKRAQNRQLAELAGSEGELKTSMDAAIEDVGETVVHGWLLERIGTRMGEVQERLTQRKLDDETTEAIASIVTRLALAIESLDVRDVAPEDQFAEGAGEGGGGAGQQGQMKPVPTVSELKLLKHLQTDLNARTVSLDAQVRGAEASEAQLRRMRSLGQEQAEIRELTTTMFGKAK